MGEAQDRLKAAAQKVVEQEAAQKAAEEAARQQEAEFQKLLATPLDETEAKKLIADNDVKLAQLEVIRVKKLDELNQIDTAIKMAKFDRSIVFRRALNEMERIEQSVLEEATARSAMAEARVLPLLGLLLIMLLVMP